MKLTHKVHPFSRGALRRRTDFNGFHDFATAIAIQQDGRIVAAGSSHISNADRGFALARYR